MSEGAAVTVRVPEWAGLLPVDKPAGPTSHDVVARARRALGTRAIGHLGTLDPGASGLLVLAVGPATRCAAVWQRGRKTYEGVARFGIVTDSQDVTGSVLATHAGRPSEADVRAAAARLTGDLMQVPPMVSALKQGGERLHAIARRGETVERAPRPVQVEHWEWLGFTADEARFRVRCSGGTYVRTLVHDLGQALGCGAALDALRRLASEPFRVDAACPWAELDAQLRDATLARYGVPLDRALDVLPSVVLDEAGARAIGHGQPAELAQAPEGALGGGWRSLVLRDAAGHALALGELRASGEGGPLFAWPQVVFPWAVREGRAA
jgi:tRNA pseudouridine55 synthase